MKKFFTKSSFAVFSLPSLLFYTVFVMLPVPILIKTSLEKHNGIIIQGWVGLQNIKDVFVDPLFWNAHLATYKVVFFTLLVSIPLSLLFALLLDRTNGWVKSFYKFTAIFPCVLSVSVIGKMFLGIFQADWGLVNTVFRIMGLDSWAVTWLSSEKYALYTIIGATIWAGIGIKSIMFYAGIKSIPTQYYEAATVDGAGFWTASIKITIPLLRNIMKYMLVTGIVGALSMYDLIFVMTQGGPNKSTQTVTYYIYETSFKNYNFGYGCAMALVFFIECILVAIIMDRLTDSENIEY